MFTQALLVALSYYLCWFADGALGFQTATRPIILGTITGVLCGDISTGIVMGAALEAVYMGISGIGGVVASDYRSATAIATGLTIMSGISLEEGIAIAAPIGAICLALMNVTTAFGNIMEPILLRLAEKGEVKKYDMAMWAFAIIGQHLIDTVVIFLSCYFGATAIEAAVDQLPAWILSGLSASGGMLVVVGLALIAQAIWSNALVFYVLLGFVLTEYLGLPTLAVAIVGAFLAFMVYDRNKRIADASKKVNVGTIEEDDFYE